jgi:hypothetical protein
MHSWATGSGKNTVGVLPDHYKTYPIQNVPVLTKLINFVNEYFSSNEIIQCEHDRTSVNHIELKIYFGKDVLSNIKIPRFGKPGIGDVNRRQMSEVRDHCDWTVSAVNSNSTGNVIGTLSVGATRLLQYRKMTGKKNVDGQVRHLPLSHGSFNLLFKVDEIPFKGPDAVTTARIKHRVIHAKRPEHGCDGNGITVGLVLRECNNLRAFYGPTTQTPYAIVPTDDELNTVNQPRKYTTRGNNGSAIKSTGTILEHAYSIIQQQGKLVRKFVQEELEPTIRQYVQSKESPFFTKNIS